jgi:hypothetical protein
LRQLAETTQGRAQELAPAQAAGLKRTDQAREELVALPLLRAPEEFDKKE